MSNVHSIEDHQTYGDTILDRLTPAPAPLKAFVKRFADVHHAYSAAAKSADAARKVRDAALGNVTTKDATQDATVDDLADALVGAKMGKRQNPFSTFTKYTPDALKRLAVKIEAKEIGALAKAIGAANPPASVRASIAASTKAAGVVLSAIAAVAKPQLAFDKALAARDAHLPAWALELNRLKKIAAAHWVDDVDTYRATFALPGAVASPKKATKATKAKRAAKRAAKNAAAAAPGVSVPK